MKYFNKVLGGSIPMNVLESFTGYQSFIRLNDNLPNFKISNYENMANLHNVPLENVIKLSKVQRTINTSLELNRIKILEGTINIFTNALRTAFSKNIEDLVQLSTKTNNVKTDFKIISEFVDDFSDSLESVMEDLDTDIDQKTKSQIMDLINLTGITNKDMDDIEEIYNKLNMEFELPDHRNKQSIDITRIIIERFMTSNCKTVTYECLFSEQYVEQLAELFIGTIETILNQMINNAKSDKVPDIFNLSIELANLLYLGTKVPIIETMQCANCNCGSATRKVIEGFGVSIGNTDITVDSTKISDMKEIEKNIDQSKVVRGMTSLLSKAITKASSKNQADLIKAISASNKLSISNIKTTSGGFTLTGITQTAKAESSTEANFVQTIQNKVINDIANELKDAVDILQKDSIRDMNKTSIDEAQGTNVGDVITGIAGIAGNTIGKLADAAKDILSADIGNNIEKRTSREISTSLKDTFNLNQGFTFEKNDEIRNDLENLLSSENLAKCAEDNNLNNDLEVKSISVTGPVTISNIKQEAIISSITKCIFNQEVLNDISNKMVTSREQLVKQLIENVNDKLTETQRKQIQGDIYAAGVAGSALLESAGVAGSALLESAGSAVSEAGQGLGKGIATASEGVGNMISSALSGMVAPLAIGLAIIVVLGIIYVIFKKMSSDDDE